MPATCRRPLEDGEHKGSVDNGDDKKDDTAAQEQFCDVAAAETVAAVPEDGGAVLGRLISRNEVFLDNARSWTRE